MKEVRIDEIVSTLENAIPLDWQESFDNSGLLCGDKDVICSGVVVCFDVCEAVIDLAIEKKCNLIISHHPLVFRGLKKFTGEDNVTKTLLKAIKNDIAVYAAHTNLDSVASIGVNTTLAKKLRLNNVRPLQNDSRAEQGYFGIGGIGELEQETDFKDFLLQVKNDLNINNIKFIEGKNPKIKTVAFCGGSGSEFIEKAIELNADCYLTGDIKYHQFLDCEGRILLADIGHFESESFIIDELIGLLSEKFCNFVRLFRSEIPNKVKNI